MNEETIQYIRAWLDKAEHDLKNAEIVLGSHEEAKPYDTVCFHCQQAAEKYLKAYLVFLNKDFPKTHNIAPLIEIGAQVDEGLNGFFEADALTAYAVEARYPDDYSQPLSLQEAESAYSIAKQIRAYVLNKMKIVFQ